MKTNLLLRCLVLLFLTNTFVEAADDSEALRAKEECLRQALDRAYTLRKEASDVVNEQELVVEATRTVAAGHAEHVSAHEKTIASYKKMMAEIEVGMARVRSPYDLTQAWNEYVRAGKTPEAFALLYQAMRGTKPPNIGGIERELLEVALEREIVQKSVVGVGPALVKLGNLLKSVVKAPKVQPRVKLEGMHKYLSRIIQKKSRVKEMAKKVFPTFISVGKKLKAAGSKLKNYKANDSNVRKAAIQLGKTVFDTVKDMEEVPEKVIEYVQEIDVGAIAQYIPVDITTKGQIGKLADQMYEQANEGLYGTKDRKGTFDGFERLKRSMTKTISKAEEVLVKAIRTKGRAELLVLSAEKVLQEKKLALMEIEDLVLDVEDEISSLNKEIKLIETKKYCSKAKGKIYATNIKLYLNRQGIGSYTSKGYRLAADELTQIALKIPRWMSLEWNCELVEFRQIPIKYNTGRKDSRGNYIYDVGKKTVHKKFATVGSYGMPNFDLDGDGATINDNLVGIVGQKAGIVNVVATIEGAREIRNEQKPWGYDSVPVLGKLKSDTISVSINEVTALDFEKGSSLESQTPVDLFLCEDTQVDHQVMNQVTLQPTLIYNDGKKSMRTYNIPYGSLKSQMIGGDGALFQQKYPQIIVASQDRPKAGYLQVGLAKGTGGTDFKKTIHLTSNVISCKRKSSEFGDNQISEDLFGNESYPLPVGENMTYELTVNGKADMRDYYVEWDYKKDNYSKVEAKRTFVKDGSRWKCHLKVQFNKSCVMPPRTYRGGTMVSTGPRLRTTKFRVVGRVIRKRDKRVVATFSPMPVNPSLTISKCKLAYVSDGGGAIPVANRLDFFRPSDPKRHWSNYLGLEVEFAVGGTFPWSLKNTRVTALSNTAGVSMTKGKGFSFPQFMQQLPKNILGEIELTATIDDSTADVLGSKYTAVPKDQKIEDSVTLVFNELTLQEVERSRKKSLQIVVNGPANMNGYYVRWFFVRPDKTLRTTFNQTEGRWTTSVPARSGFTAFKLFNSRNRELAHHCVETNGGPGVVTIMTGKKYRAITERVRDGFSLERIVPISGNNPFNVYHPVNDHQPDNYSGPIFRSGTANLGTATLFGSEHFVASFNIDPTTRQGTMAFDLTGKTLRFWISRANAELGVLNFECAPEGDFGTGVVWDADPAHPPIPAGTHTFPLNTLQTLWLKANSTGLSIKVVFQMTRESVALPVRPEHFTIRITEVEFN